MSNFIITADTTMDLPVELIRSLDIRPIVSYVSMGGEDLPDWPDITARELFDYVSRSGQLPKTAAANPLDYENFFRKIREEDDRPIIHIAKSSGISSCCENAVAAAREVPDVHVVDSLNLSSGSGMVVLKAARSELTDVKELLAELDEYKKRIQCNFVIETVDYLHKGGRCSGLAAMAAGLLKLRPEIVLDNGYLRPGRKFRGSFEKCVYTLLDEILKDPSIYEPDQVYINHTLQNPHLLEAVIKHIQDLKYFKQVEAVEACSAVATHCGPNTFALQLVRKRTNH